MLALTLPQVDARGRSCPEPVLMTKKAIETNSMGLEIMVDNTTARENIMRFGRNAGYTVEIKEIGEDFVLRLSR